MPNSNVDDSSLRVIILAPTGKDSTLTSGILTDAGIDSVVCTDITELRSSLNRGAGCLLIAEEALAVGGLGICFEALANQPPWSDLTVLLLTRYGADSPIVSEALKRLDNVALLERPLRPATLLTVIQSALNARKRQYQVRSILQAQEQVELALRDADRRKDEFLATLAHELRNPLAPIRNSLHILRLKQREDASLQQICEMMERQVAHLIRLVDDLMEVSRITRGKVGLQMEPLEIAAPLHAAIEASTPLIEASRHQLAISLPAKPLIVNGDAVRLSQIFSNLLNNSAKYMRDGGQIWLNVREERGFVVVSVRDTGVGIPYEMLPRIFEMFTQVDRSERRAQGGLGIGLTLVESLVKMHGGDVEAHSPGIDQGSEFIVRLPLCAETVHSSLKLPDIHPQLLTNRRVLVVDDNIDAALSLASLLNLLGADTRIVNNGPAALEILPRYRPTMVILDIGMPGMDGYEVARRIRSQVEWNHVLLVALTGWGQEEDRHRTMQAGFNYHLLKPADMKILQALLAADDEPKYC